MTDAATAGTTTNQPDPAVIDDAEQLIPSWFDAVLGTAGTPSAVRSVATEPVGTGQMAATVRARLGLADGTERSVVVKYARAGETSAMAGMAYGKEVAFYADLGHRVAIRTPACHYAATADEAQRFVLVLEDLDGARQGDQIAGCTVEQAEASLLNLAGLHGPTWCDADLAASDWLTTDPAIDASFLAPVIEVAADAFAERFAAELDGTESAVLEASRELLAPWVFDHDVHFAVTHGDYRLDNLLFDDDPATVTAVDWQTAATGPAARDLAFFLATSVEVDVRRRHEDDLVASYHRALVSHGVTGYSLDDCVADYRVGMLHAPLIILLGRLTAGVTERGDTMFRAMWRRSAAAIDDHGTVDLVRARVLS